MHWKDARAAGETETTALWTRPPGASLPITTDRERAALGMDGIAYTDLNNACADEAFAAVNAQFFRKKKYLWTHLRRLRDKFLEPHCDSLRAVAAAITRPTQKSSAAS